LTILNSATKRVGKTHSAKSCLSNGGIIPLNAFNCKRFAYIVFRGEPFILFTDDLEGFFAPQQLPPNNLNPRPAEKDRKQRQMTSAKIRRYTVYERCKRRRNLMQNQVRMGPVTEL
jgi:hypothetical protein